MNTRDKVSWKCISVLFLLIFTTNSFAALVSGSAGFVDIVGDLSDPLTPGSFTVRVKYAVFDGGAGFNPLGNDGDGSKFQVAFELEHLGSGGEPPTLNVGRFTVFTHLENLASLPHYTINYDQATYIDQSIGGLAPIFINESTTANTVGVQYYFMTLLQVPLLGPVEVLDGNPPVAINNDFSQMMVMTFDPSEMPLEDILVEINGADGNVHGDARITLIPEPCSLLLMAGGVVLLNLRKRRSAV